jgi:hypothetical protein
MECVIVLSGSMLTGLWGQRRRGHEKTAEV